MKSETSYITQFLYKEKIEVERTEEKDSCEDVFNKTTDGGVDKFPPSLQLHYSNDSKTLDNMRSEARSDTH